MYLLFTVFQIFAGFALFQYAIAACVAENNNKTSLIRTDNSPAGILKLLDDGEQLIELDEEDRDLIAFIGITGSGKTTLVLHVGSDNEDLISKETRPGSKEYLIDDKCNRSSSAARSLESFTLVPNRFIDSQTMMTYIDMPGFSDTRPAVAYDIAATYFSKKVFDYARRIKLVLVVNHSHLKVGEDRGRFTELVEHVTRLVRNITKFKDSIALVATKVENQYDPDGPANFPYISDNVVIDGIAYFLGIARSVYKEQNKTEAVRLVDILLHTTSKKFDRLGIFRRPDGPGPLSNVRSLKGSKERLKTIIDRNIYFAEKDVADFGYTLSEKSRNLLHKLEEEVQQKATTMIHALGLRILNHFKDRENGASELEDMLSLFNVSAIQVSGFHTIREFTSYFLKYAQAVGVPITEEDTKVLEDNEYYLNFLNGIIGKENVDWSSTIQDGMRDLVEYMQYSQSWYLSILNEMDTLLSGYEIQRVRFRYNASSRAVQNQIDQLSVTQETINSTQLTTLAQFLRETGEESLLLRLSTNAVNLNKKKLLLLKTLLKTTINYPETKILCQDKTLTIKGHYLRLSQVVDKLPGCPGLRSMEILALQKIFIDSNLNLAGTGIELVMVAPLWVTTGQVEITLNGKDAAQFPYPKALSGNNSDSQAIRNGKHGLPGMPGESAGHFIGVGVKIINGDHLSITAVGGAGGDGQHGGDGYRGKDGASAPSYTGDEVVVANDVMWANHASSETTVYTSGFWRSVGYVLGVAPDKTVRRVEVHGIPASKGGSGGNGGPYGMGGRRGKVMIAHSLKNSSMKCLTKDGSNGKSGKAGSGAEGGRNGDTLVETYTVQEYWWSSPWKELSANGYRSPSSEYARDGHDGIDGDERHSEIQSNPEVPFSMPDFKKYRTFVDSNLPYCLHKNPLLKLRNILDKDSITLLTC